MKNDKINLQDCSVIVPFAFDSEKRLENLRCLIRYFSQFFFGYEWILVQHAENEANEAFEFPDATVLIDYGTDFSKSKLVNIGASRSTKPFLCICDTDLLIDPGAIEAGIRLLRKDETTAFVIPNNGMSFNVKDPLRKNLMETFAFNCLPFFESSRSLEINSAFIQSKNFDAKGLIHLFRKSVFRKLGGYNEEFVSWGFEDNEMIIRFQQLGYPPARITNYNVFHLDHPRGRTYHAEDTKKNIQRLKRIKAMNASQLKEYIKQWSRFPP